jgi:hypothetical protein
MHLSKKLDSIRDAKMVIDESISRESANHEKEELIIEELTKTSVDKKVPDSILKSKHRIRLIRPALDLT